MFIDLVMTHKIESGSKIQSESAIPIYPKRLSIGPMELVPKDDKGVSIPSVGLLISTEFSDDYYSDLVIEINRGYGYGLYTSALVLTRKLFENLLIDLLRTRYKIDNMEFYYNKKKGMFHNLSTLVGNLRKNCSDFEMFTKRFDEDFLFHVFSLFVFLEGLFFEANF